MRASQLLGLATIVSMMACSACGAPTPPAQRENPPSGEATEEAHAADEESDDPLPSETAVSASLLAEADRERALVKSTTYSHRTSIDENVGRFDYDCSGFVGYAARHVHPDALEPIAHAGKQRPLAEHFEAFFASLGGGGAPLASGGKWEHVDSIANIQPGDVVAWLKPPSSPSKNTGHVVIAHAAPKKDEKHEHTWTLEVADSTAIPHGRSDPRSKGKASGLGVGTLALVGDAAGRPRGIRWSAAGPLVETPTAIGRLH